MISEPSGSKARIIGKVTGTADGQTGVNGEDKGGDYVDSGKRPTPDGAELVTTATPTGTVVTEREKVHGGKSSKKDAFTVN